MTVSITPLTINGGVRGLVLDFTRTPLETLGRLEYLSFGYNAEKQPTDIKKVLENFGTEYLQKMWDPCFTYAVEGYTLTVTCNFEKLVYWEYEEAARIRRLLTSGHIQVTGGNYRGGGWSPRAGNGSVVTTVEVNPNRP